jgi:ABC-type phosphate/phosphonate transport system substrate-binding protein
MLIANARMYSVTARAATAWRALLEWVIERAGVSAEAIDYPPTRPIASLWARRDLGCAFICGYPYALAAPKPILLAAPVPSPDAYGGKPVYWSDIVVRADAPFAGLGDVFGHRLGYTTEDSQSGYQAVRELLAPYAHEAGGRLFTATVGPLITPRRVAEAIIAGEADAGPLDSYAHDLIRAHEPQFAAQLKTIATTTPTPIPPLVAAPGIAAADVERLRAALLDTAKASELRSIRTALLLDGFALVEPEDYGVLLQRARDADRYGYPRLA